MQEVMENIIFDKTSRNSLSVISNEQTSSYSSKTLPYVNEGEFNEEEGNPILKSISSVIERLLKDNSQKNDYSRILKLQKKCPFNSSGLPNISIYDYLLRIMKYGKVEIPSLILMLIYIDRLCRRGHFILTNKNVHRIILVSTVVSVKYNEDCAFTNKYYAKVGGIDTKSLNNMEYEFLSIMNFNLFVDKNSYKKYEQNIFSII